MKIFKAFCFLILAAGFVFAQKPKVSRNQNKYVPKIVARAGWTTPVFAPNLTENIRQIEEVANPSEIPNGFGIKTSRYFLTERRLVQVESCGLRIDASDKRNTFVVDSFSALEYKGRVFAYKIHFIGAYAYENGVVSGLAGCVRPAMYVDEDGDGKFKLQCGSESVYLPQWIYEAENEKLNLPQSNWTSVLFNNVVESSGKRFPAYIENAGEMIGFEAKTFLFNRERLINFEFCSKSDGVKTSEKAQVQYLAESFVAYEIKGRVFAYEFPKVRTPKFPRITEPSPKEVATGCIDMGRSFVFMDEDGDGTFEHNCDRTDLKPLPQWVVDLGEIRIRTSK